MQRDTTERHSSQSLTRSSFQKRHTTHDRFILSSMRHTSASAWMTPRGVSSSSAMPIKRRTSGGSTSTKKASYTIVREGYSLNNWGTPSSRSLVTDSVEISRYFRVFPLNPSQVTERMV